MKKFTTFAISILALLSCVIFSACADKYKKLQMQFIYSDGSAIEKLVLVLDDNKPELATKRIGVKFSNIDKDDIGQVVVYSSPSDLFITSNEVYSENYFYFNITAIKSSDSDCQLIVKHLGSNKTSSVTLRVEQKSNDLISTSKKYVVGVNDIEEGESKQHILKTSDLVSLQPSNSTDKIYFKESNTYNSLPYGVSKLTETVDGVEYVTGFKIESGAGKLTGGYKLIPVCKMEGYPDKEYTDREITINFENTLNDNNVGLDTDADHKVDGEIYEPIYLVANDIKASASGEYNYNNSQFELVVDSSIGTLSDFLQYYSISVVDNSSVIQSSHIGSGRFVVQTSAYTEQEEVVTFKMTPKNIVGDVEEIVKTIKVKGVVRSDTIGVAKKDETIDINETIDIYNYIASGNSNGVKFTFKAVANGDAPIYSDFAEIRLAIAPEILYLEADAGYYTNVLDGENKIPVGTTEIGTSEIRKLCNQKKVISIIKNNERLMFTYDDTMHMFISEPFTESSNIYIKYIETTALDETAQLTMKALAGYEGEHNYLKGIERTEITLNFDTKEGVKELTLFASNSTESAASITHTIIKDVADNEIPVDKIYINKDINLSSPESGHELVFSNNSVKGVNGSYIYTVEFDVEINYLSGKTSNPIGIAGLVNNKIKINNMTGSVYYKILFNNNTSVGEYEICLRQKDTGFEKIITCYIYKEFKADYLTLNFAENDLDNDSFQNYYYNAGAKEYIYNDYVADYIVYAGKTLNLTSKIDDEVLSSNIVKKYQYSAEIPGLTLSSYFNFETDSTKPEISKLNFINKGTIKGGTKHYITYTITIKTRKFVNILQEDVTHENEDSLSITFFVYERILNGANSKASLNYSVLEKYMYDYIGYYNQADCEADFVVNMEENLWNYVQDQEVTTGVFKKVIWCSSEDGITSNGRIEFENDQDKSITAKFCDNSGVEHYNCYVEAQIKQFNKIIPLRCSVLVKRPVLTEELKLTTSVPTFERLSTNTKDCKIFEYNIDLKMDDQFTISAEHISKRGDVTHKGITIVVANTTGETTQEAVEISSNTIKVNRIQSDLHLIIYSTDVLKDNVYKYTSGFNLPELYIRDYHESTDVNKYKGSYFIINLHLEDGKTKETAYRVYNKADFEEMLNSSEIGKWYQIMNDINLSELNVYNKAFAGHIYSENNYNIYNLKLNEVNKNLFTSYTGTIENIILNVEYNYKFSNYETNLNLGVIGELTAGSRTKDVSVKLSGGADFVIAGSAKFGGFVGVNNGEIVYENINATVIGSLELKGQPSVDLGGIVGENNGTVKGCNENKSTLNSTTSADITFSNDSTTQGATCQITITANGSSGSCKIGGIIGRNRGTLQKVYVVGSIDAATFDIVGGAIGQSDVSAGLTYTYNSGNITVNTATEEDVANIKHVKSSVVIKGKNDVGGIVGSDEGGALYYRCWYQILPTTDTAIIGENCVGGIVGYSNYSKLRFCSVMSYKYNYTDEGVCLENMLTKAFDIVGNDYVAGLIGYAVDTGLGTGASDITGSTIIRNSSVNATIKSSGAVSAMFASTDISVIQGVVKSSYFIGRLSGTCNSADLSFNNVNKAIVSDSYSAIANTIGFTYGEIGVNRVTPISGTYWNKYDNINLNYIYVSSSDSENSPIFDLVPNSFDVVTSEGTKELALTYYDFSSSTTDTETLKELNNAYNQKQIISLLNFVYAPQGKILISVKSDNTNVISIDGGKLCILSTGSAVLTFTPVLNTKLPVEITVNVAKSLSGVVVSQDGVAQLSEMQIAKGTTKQLQTYSVGEVSHPTNGMWYSYKSTNEYGLMLTIEWDTSNSSYLEAYNNDKDVLNYITINGGEEVTRNVESSKVYIPYGTPFSITANKVNGIFKISVAPHISKTVAFDGVSSTEFTLSTKIGASKLMFNYDYAIVYPNDETDLVVTITTDIKLEPTNLNELIYNLIVIENGKGDNINNANYSDYIELKHVGDFVEANQTQVATFKVKISDKFASTKTSSNLKISFKTEYSSVQTVEFTILPQSIDKIEIKSYIGAKVGSGYELNYELSEVLKPNDVGVLAIDISPINGYFDYLEIDDITGDEEIKFIQLEKMGGQSLYEVDNPSSSNKGIRLVKVAEKDASGNTKVDADGNIVYQSTIYVSMQIDKKYTAKTHTLAVKAYYKDGTLLKTDYKYIDVKMLPIINVEYQLPNGESKYYETQTVNNKETFNNLYFAIGTEAEFRITTSNATQPLEYNLSLGGCNGQYSLVNTHGDFYILTNRTIDSNDLGKKLTIELETSSIINNEIETVYLNIEFTVVQYVIHSVSVTNSNSKGEIYGNLGVSADLRFYLKATDISFNNNGTYHDVSYEYDSALSSSASEALKYINAVLCELNTNAEDYLKINYGLNSEYIRAIPSGNEIDSGKYITNTSSLKDWNDDKHKNKVSLQTVANENKLLVYDGYYENTYLAVDMELELNTSNNLWSVQTNVTNSSIDLSKNYKLNFTRPYEEDSYQLIKNVEDFLAMSDGESNRYILGNDLVLEDYTPMDVNIAEFDGNGRTITIKSFALFKDETISAGLFAQVYENMIVKNVNVEYSSVRKETVYSFGKATANSNSSKAKDFTVEYADICNDYTVNYKQATFGGLASVNNGIITNCTVNGQIALRASTIETNKESTTNGYNIAFNIGGLVGINSATGYITHSTSGLKIFALANIGGLVYENEGKIASSAVEDNATIYSYNINLEKTILVAVGGFVAENSGKISMSHTTLNFNGTYGFMSTKDESAGFVYNNEGEISNCYVNISQIGDHNNIFCGFVFKNSAGSISNVYTSINKGEHSDANVYMFAQEGTMGLTDCLEFVYTDKNGYVSNQSDGLTSVNYINVTTDVSKVKQIFEENNFVFGNTNSAVWKFETNLPVLVACEDEVRYSKNEASSGSNYYGLRNILYEKVTNENTDGTISYEYEVQFVDDSYGKKENPFIIANLSNWDNRFYDGTTAYYRIVSDIEFSSYLNPSSSTKIFSGNIQGNDMTLSNIKLYLKEEIDSIGLFKALESMDDVNIDNSVRNLNLEITSGWASKADALGTLSGRAIGFNLYNIKVNNQSEVLVGGNAVGGIVGYLSGEFDVDGVSSNLGVNSTRELNTYRYSIYLGHNNISGESNLSSVYYAGSIFGIADGHDKSRYDITGERYLNGKYYEIKHAKVYNSPVLIGDSVGAVCGFVGERVRLSHVDVAAAKFKGYQYSAGIAGENRGIIENAVVNIGDNSFDETMFAVGGLVGLNIGGLIKDVKVTANIIRSGSVSVGGIVARNINGTIQNAEFVGQLFGSITGGIMASDYSKELFEKNNAAGAIKYSIDLDYIVPVSDVVYKENSISADPLKFENLKLSKETVDYFVDNISKFYIFNKKSVGAVETVVQDNFRAFGLLVGMTDDDSLGLGLNIEYNEYIRLGVGSSEVTEKDFEHNEGDDFYVVYNEDLHVIEAGESTKKYEIETLKNAKFYGFNRLIDSLCIIYITGVKTDVFDSWDKKAFTNNFIMFGSSWEVSAPATPSTPTT